MEKLTPDIIQKLLLRYLTGNLDESGKKQLDRWRRESPVNEALFSRIISKDFVKKNREKCLLTPQENEKEWEKIKKRTFGKTSSLSHRMIRYAALFLLPLGICLFLLQKNTNTPGTLTAASEQSEDTPKVPILTLANGSRIILENEGSQEVKLNAHASVRRSGDTLHYTRQSSEEIPLQFNTLSVPKGTDYHLMLSDGTIVYLNTSSSLRYPVAFKGDKREVELTGEGYFKVKRDTTHPFIVKANGVAVKVLGTSFNVRAYEDEKGVFTTLVEGSVRVNTQKTGIVLQPSQQAVCQSESTEISIQTVNTDYYVSWISGRFVFNNTRLDDILRQLQKWYNFEVFYQNKEMQDLPFSLNMLKYDDFSKILKAIERTEKVKFLVKGKSVVVQEYK